MCIPRQFWRPARSVERSMAGDHKGRPYGLGAGRFVGAKLVFARPFSTRPQAGIQLPPSVCGSPSSVVMGRMSRVSAPRPRGNVAQPPWLSAAADRRGRLRHILYRVVSHWCPRCWAESPCHQGNIRWAELRWAAVGRSHPTWPNPADRIDPASPADPVVARSSCPWPMVGRFRCGRECGAGALACDHGQDAHATPLYFAESGR
jgi:hypothetical protein